MTLALLLATACGGRATPAVHPGTAKMIARLERIASETDPFANPYRNVERAQLLKERELPTEPGRIRARKYRIGLELLLAGQTLEGIAELEAVEPAFAPGALRPLIAAGWLQLGKEENCVLHHGTQSCLFPIEGSGVHTRTRGSTQAAEVLLAHLRERPDDLGPRWLLNLAHMTLGTWPEGVDPRWRMGPELFRSEYPLPRFKDIAGALGVDFIGLAGGAALEDFDGDGDLDIFATSGGLHGEPSFARNAGSGRFEDATESAGLRGLVGGLNLVHADYDNDGDADVFVLRGAWLGVPPATDGGAHPNSLLRNRGDGTFEDVTEEAGLLSLHPTQTAVWRDFDGDGWLDLFVGNETTSVGEHPCELYRSNGDGTFTEVAAAAGVAARGLIKGVCAGDADNDGRADLYVSRLSEPNLLFMNRTQPGGALVFEESAAEAGVDEPVRSFPCWFFDYDNDGDEDLFVSGYGASDPEVLGDVTADYLGEHAAERCRLYRNRGNGTFEDVADELGLDGAYFTMGCNYGDFDSDGWLDIYLGTGDPRMWVIVPNRSFRNDQGQRFQDVTTAAGFGHLQKGHGVAFGDVDGDGDQDVYMSLGGFHPGDTFHNALFENPGGAGNSVTLQLEGVRANRCAIGARIEVVVGGAQPRSIHVTAGTGGSFGGSSLAQEVGLGAATEIQLVRVRWPGSGAVDEYEGLEPGRSYHLREGGDVQLASVFFAARAPEQEQ